MSWHSVLPWSWVRSLYAWTRRTLFTRSRPEGPYLQVDGPVGHVEQWLGKRGYAPNWEFSYNYRGEDMNLANVHFGSDPLVSGTGIRWWQVHVRGWQEEGSTYLSAHHEPEPTEHPDAHLSGEHVTTRTGMDEVCDLLEAAPHHVEEVDAI